MDYGSNNNTLSLTGGDNIDDITDTLLNLANTTSNNQTLINNNTLLINDVSSSLNTLDIQVQDISGSLDTLDTQVQSLSNSVDGKANDADVVKLTGDQSIAGNKLFTEDITIHKGSNSRPKLILSGESNTRQYGSYIAYDGDNTLNDLEIGTISNYTDVKLLWADRGQTNLKCVGDIRAYAGGASEISMFALDANVDLALSRGATALNQISTINGITIPNINSVIDDLSSNHYALNDVVTDLSTNFYTTEHGANIINLSNTLTDLSSNHYALNNVVVDLSTNFYVLTGTTIPNINLVIDDLSSNHYTLYNLVVDLCGNVATNISTIADISGLVQVNIADILAHNTRITDVEDTLQDLQDELDEINVTDPDTGVSVFDAIFGAGTAVSLATVASLAYQAYTIAVAAAASATTANSTNATQAIEIEALEQSRQINLVDTAFPVPVIQTNEAGIYNITSSGLIDANEITATDISATTISANGFSSTTGYGTGNTQITPSYTDIYSSTTTISGETINITGNTAVNVNGNINLNGNNITGVNVLSFSGSSIEGLDTLNFKTATNSNASISNLKSVSGENFTIQADGDAIFGSKTISTLQTATQVGTLITTAINALIGNAGSGYDTLVELQNEIENNDLSLNEVFENVATKVSKSGDTMTGLLNLRNGDNGDYLRFNGERSWLWYSTSSGGSTDLRLKDEWNGKEWKYVTQNDTVWAKWKFDNTLSVCKLEFLGGSLIMSNNTEIYYKGDTLDERFQTAGDYALSSELDAEETARINGDALKVNKSGDTMTGDLSIGADLSVAGTYNNPSSGEPTLYTTQKYTHTIFSGISTLYYKIAELPVTSNSTKDYVRIQATAGYWTTSSGDPRLMRMDITLRARTAFSYDWNVEGYNVLDKVTFYAKRPNAGGVTEIWVQVSASYIMVNYNIEAVGGANIITPPTSGTPPVSGYTTLFNSSITATYPPKVRHLNDVDITGQLKITGEGGAILDLIGTTHAYIEYYPEGISAGRKAYMGFPNTGAVDFTIANQYTGGKITMLNDLSVSGNATATGNITSRGAIYNSMTGFYGTAKPSLHLLKTNGGGGGIVMKATYGEDDSGFVTDDPKLDFYTRRLGTDTLRMTLDEDGLNIGDSSVSNTTTNFSPPGHIQMLIKGNIIRQSGTDAQIQSYYDDKEHHIYRQANSHYYLSGDNGASGITHRITFGYTDELYIPVSGETNKAPTDHAIKFEVAPVGSSTPNEVMRLESNSATINGSVNIGGITLQDNATYQFLIQRATSWKLRIQDALSTFYTNLDVQGLYNVRGTPLITQTWGFYQKGSAFTGNAWLNHAPIRDNNSDGVAGMVSPVDIVPYAISVSVEDDGSSSTDTGNVTFYVKCIGYTDPANSGLLKRSDLQNLETNVINRGNCTISMGRNVTDYRVLTSPNLIPAGVSFGIYFTESITNFASEVVVKLFCTQY